MKLIVQRLGQKFNFKVVSPRKSVVSNGMVMMKTQSGQPALISRKVGAGSAYLLVSVCRIPISRLVKQTIQDRMTHYIDLFMRCLVMQRLSHMYIPLIPEIEAGLRSDSKVSIRVCYNHESTNP